MSTLAPTVVLAIWAAGYLLDCLRTVARPGTPLDLVLPTRGGPIRITASSWSLDVTGRRLTVSHARLFSPSGDLIASAEHIWASGPRQGQGAYSVGVSGLTGKLERLKDGSYRHADLLPEPRKQPSETAFDVEIVSGEVTFLDRTSPTPWKGRATLAGVGVSGVGDRWIASGEVDVAGVGKITAALRRRADAGVDFDVAGTDLEATPLIDHFTQAREGRTWTWLRKVRSGSLVIGGSAKGSADSRGLRLVAKVDARGSGVGYAEDLKSATGSFSGTVTEHGASGKVDLTESGSHAMATGGVEWAAGFSALGDVDYDLSDSAAAPPLLKRLIPKDLKLRAARFKGRVAYAAKAYEVNGDLTAGLARYGGESLRNPVATLAFDNGLLGVKIDRAEWLGGSVAGQVDVDLARKTLSGYLSSHGVALAQGARRFGRNELTGRANAQAVLGGTVDSPHAALRALATASVALKGEKPTSLGNVEFAGTYSGKRLTISRLSSAGPNGVFSASGTWDLASKRLAGDAFGNGVLLSAFKPDLAGTALLRAHIAGKAASPLVAGRAEIVGAKLDDTTVPFVGGEFKWDGRRLQATGVKASKGATTAEGDLAWDPSNGRIEGRFKASGILLQDWLKGDVGGSLAVTSGTIGGTVGKPVLSATVAGQALVAEGVRVDSLGATLGLAGKRVDVSNMVIKADKGTLTADGFYDTAGRRGDFKAAAKDIPLDRFLSAAAVQRFLGESAPRTSVAGSWSGTLGAHVEGDALRTLAATGTLTEVGVNGTRIGNGEWHANLDGATWTGSLLVGELERFIEIPKFSFDTNTRSVAADFDAYHLALRNIAAAIKPLIPDESPEVADRLDGLDGLLDIGATMSGSIDDPNVDLSSLKATALSLGHTPSGSVELKAKREHRTWTVAGLTWSAPDGNLVAKGRIAEDGDVDIDGELSDFRLGWLGAINPDLAKLAGRADVPFLVSGPIGSPVVTASLKGQSFGLAGGQDSSGPVVFDLNLTSILLREGSLHAEGGFVYRGITGDVTADLPFEYPFRIPDDKPVHAEVTLPKRPLSDFAEYADWIDFGATKGSIEGSATLDGTTAALRQSGSIKLTASTLAFAAPKGKAAGDKSRPVKTSLRDFQATVSLHDRALAVDASATGGAGGSLVAHVEAPKLDPLDILEGATDQLLGAPVSGSFKVNGFAVDEEFGNQGRIAFKSTGALAVSGQIRSPLIAGSLAFSGTSGTAPSDFGQPRETPQPTVNPRFQIGLSVAQGSRLKSSTAEFSMHGSGTVTGSLYRPVADMNLAVEQGSIKLPNAKIRIEPGGTMQFGYRVGQDGVGVPRLDIDLTGNTNVTALRFGDTLERYAVTMRLTGDILDQNQMRIVAQSNPPDLNQDQIMAILGQGALFEGLAKGNESTLAGYAIPAVFDPLTQKLASQLGLDYLNLEYDSFDRAMISAARSLGSGFSIMARRQVSDSTVGPLLYDVRLSYHLPFQNRTLRSFSIGIGSDQDRPWKITFEYGTRF